jgi:hypothetical protein
VSKVTAVVPNGGLDRTDIVSAAALRGGGKSIVSPADDAFFVDL